MNKLSREAASDVLNNYCLELGIDESDFIEYDLKDAKEVDDMIKEEIISPEQKEEELSKRDIIRETIVQALCKGILFIKEDGNLYMKPRYIPTDEDGTPILDELKIKRRVLYKEEKHYMKGIRADDGKSVVFAKICARVSKPRPILENLDTRDIDILNGVEVFFQRAD